jgi:hypothetical protein
MVLLFFPPMTLLAWSLERTSFFIVANESLSFPVLTGLECIVIKYLGFPSEVLPVVGIITLGLVVVFVEGTPLSLEVEHVEVRVLVHEVDYTWLNVSFGVGKGTVLTIVTLHYLVGELSAVLSLVLLNVIQSFHSIVGQLTLLSERTPISLSILTHVWVVLSPTVGSSLVLVRVPEGTMFMVVLVVDLTLLYLELLQVQMLDLLIVVSGGVDLNENVLHVHWLATSRTWISLVRPLFTHAHCLRRPTLEGKGGCRHTINRGNFKHEWIWVGVRHVHVATSDGGCPKL